MLTLAATGLGLLSACSSAPAAVDDGTYRAFAASGELGRTPEASVEVRDDRLTFTTPAGPEFVADASRGTQDFVVCPPQGSGTPDPLSAPLTLDGVTFERPAVFGDCGQTTPARITVVDLESGAEGSGPFPFTRWIEFCDTADPDC